MYAVDIEEDKHKRSNKLECNADAEMEVYGKK